MKTPAEEIVETLLDSPTEGETEVMTLALCKHLSGLFHTQVEPVDLNGVIGNDLKALYYRHVMGMSLGDIGIHIGNQATGAPIAKPSVSRKLRRGFSKIVANLGPDATRTMRVDPEVFHGK